MFREKRLLSFIRWSILASFFTPLIFSGFFYFPYIVPKTLVFQVLVEVALFFYIILVFKNKKYLFKFDNLTKSVLAFFSIYTIAGVFGEDVFRSFFGNFERMLGIVNLAHFVILFLIIKSTFVSFSEWIVAFRTFIFAGFLVAIYGLFQKMGLSFVYNAGTNRIDSTIGNAAFFAGYMIFNLFFSIFLLLKDKLSSFKYFYIISIFVSLLAIYLSSTRGAILATITSFVFFAIALLVKFRSSLKDFFTFKNSIFKWFLVGVSVFFIIGFFAQNAFLDPIKRISSISLSDTTTKTRILSAGVSWQGFLNAPILGYGPENYNLVFDKYYNPKLYPTENWFDHAHNIIFDTLASSGILGFLAYLSILFFAVYVLFKRKEISHSEYVASLLFMALILAYFLQNLFVFDALVTYLGFFFLLAYISYIYSEEGRDFISEKKSFSKVPIQLVFILVIVFSFIVYNVNIRPALASYYGIEALRYIPDQPKQAISYFQKSLDVALQGKPEIRSKAMESVDAVFKSEKNSSDDKIEFLNFAKEEGKKTLKEHPKDFRYYLFYSSLMFFDYQNKDFLREVESLLEGISDSAPNKPPLYLNLYQVKSFLGKDDDAIENLKKAMTLYSDIKLNMVLARSYSKIGKKEEALKIYESILKDDKIVLQDMVNIAIDLAQMGEKKRAIEIAEEIIKIQGPTEDALNFIESVKSGKFERDENRD